MKTILLLVALLLGGCRSSFHFEPPRGHPAHPGSAVAPLPEVPDPADAAPRDAPETEENEEDAAHEMEKPR